MTVNPEALVTQFIKTFGGSLDPRVWLKLIKEELDELEEALELFTADKTVERKAHMLKELADLIYVCTGLQLTASDNAADLLPTEELEELAAIHERMESVTQVVAEYFPNIDGVVDEAFQLVHESNMSKLGEDGKPIRREDGKVLKGPNYKEPNLLPLVA